MANKREFKKYVTEVSSSIVREMMTVYYNVEGVNHETIDHAIVDILKSGEKAIMHTNVKFDKSPKAFESKTEYSKARAKFYSTLYRKVNSEFATDINSAISKFNSAVPAETKKNNIHA